MEEIASQAQSPLPRLNSWSVIIKALDKISNQAVTHNLGLAIIHLEATGVLSWDDILPKTDEDYKGLAKGLRKAGVRHTNRTNRLGEKLWD